MVANESRPRPLPQERTAPGGDGHGRDGSEDSIKDEACRHLAMLADTIGERPTGSGKSRLAEEYIRKYLETLGYNVEMQEFQVRAWEEKDARCLCSEREIPVVANTYSPPCSVTAPSVVVSTKNELDRADLHGKIVIMQGDLTREALMPRNFRFYRHEEHIGIIETLEAKRPRAVITVSPDQSCAVPVIIDGDVAIPSCTVAAPAGSALVAGAGESVTLTINTLTRMTRSANVIGRIPAKTPGKDSGKIVFCAHLDTKFGTPGALDNASGVAALLVLARLFSRLSIENALEFVFFNGEECYCAPGESAYLDAGYCSPDSVLLGINIDGIGLAAHNCSISYYGCQESTVAKAKEILEKYPGVVPVDPWPQGDHMIFFMQEIPCMAFSTECHPDKLTALIHTPADTIQRIDPDLVASCIRAVEELIRGLSDPKSLRNNIHAESPGKT